MMDAWEAMRKTTVVQLKEMMMYQTKENDEELVAQKYAIDFCFNAYNDGGNSARLCGCLGEF